MSATSALRFLGMTGCIASWNEVGREKCDKNEGPAAAERAPLAR